jgi:hypothetical protein
VFCRLCEERKRRSNPSSFLAWAWIASLTLAMTVVRANGLFEIRINHFRRPGQAIEASASRDP